MKNTNTTIDDMRATIENDAINAICDILDNLDNEELCEIASAYTGNEVYTDFDELFYNYSPSDIVYEYTANDIDENATFFMRGNDIVSTDFASDLFDFTEFARECLETGRDYSNDDINDIVYNYERDIEKIENDNHARENALNTLEKFAGILRENASADTIQIACGELLKIINDMEVYYHGIHKHGKQYRF